MIFRDREHQRRFEEDGYVIFDLLDPERVRRLLDLFGQTVGAMPKTGLFESSRFCDLDTNLRIMNGIREVFEEPVAGVFSGKLFGGTFYDKVGGTSEVLPLHQDWSVVEEDRYESAYIWCALVDVSPDRGGLFVLPGSHRFFDNLRSGSMPSARIPPQGPLADLVVDIRLRAGQAIAYSDRLFHGSRANRTREPRIICTGRVNQAGASLVYYHPVDESHVAVVEVTPEWWLKDAEGLVAGKLLEGNSTLRTIEYRYVPVTTERLYARLVELGKLKAVAGA